MLQQHEIGGLLGHVHRLVHRDAHVGGVQGRGVVDPVAHVADDVTPLLQGQDDAFLLVGVHLDEEGRPLHDLPQRLVAQIVQLGTGQDTGHLQPHRLRRVQGHQSVVAGDDLELHAQFGQVGDSVLHARLWRVEEKQKAHKRHIELVIATVLRLHQHFPDRYAQYPETLVAPCLEASLNIGASAIVEWHDDITVLHPRADRQHVVQRTLGDQQQMLPFLHHHAQPLAHKVVRHLVYLRCADSVGLSVGDDGLVQRVG